MAWHELLKDGLIAHGALDTTVSLMILRNGGLMARQKIGQLLLVWLVPFFGSVLIGIFLWTQSGAVPPSGYPSEPHRGPAGVGMVANQPPAPSAAGG